MSAAGPNEPPQPPPTGVFATTHWSVVLVARDTASPGAEAALAELCRIYWYPLYAFVRRQGHSLHDAQDLTQAFFARLLAKRTTSPRPTARAGVFAPICWRPSATSSPTNGTRRAA